MNSILVTGANGFIGSELVRRVARQGTMVRTLSRHSATSPQKSENILALRGDIRDREAVDRAVDGIDAVFHLAAEKRERALMYGTNVQGTENLLEAAVECGVRRFVYCSTCSVYGPPRDMVIDEESTCYPESDYARSKLMGEELVRNYAATKGLDTLIVRPTWVFGEGDPRYTFVDLFRLARRGVMLRFGQGEGMMNFVYLTDFVEMMLDLAGDDSVSNQTFIVSDHCRTFEAMELISGLVDGKPKSIQVPHSLGKLMVRIPRRFIGISFAQLREFGNSRLFSTDRIGCRASYSQRLGILEGIRSMFEYYAALGLLGHPWS